MQEVQRAWEGERGDDGRSTTMTTLLLSLSPGLPSVTWQQGNRKSNDKESGQRLPGEVVTCEEEATDITSSRMRSHGREQGYRVKQASRQAVGNAGGDKK